MKQEEVDSPFLLKEPTRIGFGTMMILLMMVVSAGVGLLIYYAMRVPAITSEINAWFGRPNPPFDRSEARKAQVVFALCVYTAPLAMGIFVYILHYLVNWMDRLSGVRKQSEDDPFRME